MENQTPETPQSTQNRDETLFPIQTTSEGQETPIETKLREETKVKAVCLFARGYHAPLVCDCLLEDPPPELQAAIQHVPEQELRKSLLGQLRSCNPTDTKFASTKYLDIYNAAHAAFLNALTAKSHQIVTQQVTHLENFINDASALMETTKGLLSDASEITITGNPEFTKTASLFLATQKAMAAAATDQLNLLLKSTEFDRLKDRTSRDAPELPEL